MTMLIFGVAATLAVASANVAYACPPGGEHGMQRMADELKLSDQQRQQFKSIHSEGRDAGKAMHEAMRLNRDALQKLDPDAKDYSRQVGRLAEEKGELVKQMVIERSKERARIHAMLTPEQREKAAAFKRDSRRDGKGKHERGGPDGERWHDR